MIGEPSNKLVTSLYLFTNLTPEEAVLTIVVSSLLLSSANHLGFLQMIGLIQTNDLLLYIEASPALTPGFVLANFQWKK
jgi:hypothetical protein